MRIYGKAIRQTEKAVLFHIFDQCNELPAELHDKEFWFPASQIIGGAQRHTDGTRDLFFAPHYMEVSGWVLSQKAKEVGFDLTAWMAAQDAAAQAEKEAEIAEQKAAVAAMTVEDWRRIANNTAIVIAELRARMEGANLSAGQIARRRKELRGLEQNLANATSQIARLAALNGAVNHSF